MTTMYNPVPVVSSQLISALFGENVLTAIETERKKYRALTELVSPQVQGHNAYKLANYVIAKADASKELLRQAKFFIEQWDSNTCYLCGLPIDGKTQNEELEHILPIGLALGLLGIIQDNSKKFGKKLSSGMIDDRTALTYLLEYARSHACCNQIKSSISFLKWNGEIYDVDRNRIKHVLRRICNSKELGLQQLPTHCANKLWLRHMVTHGNCEQFVKTRSEIIVANFIQPIVNNITKSFEKDENVYLTQLVFLANQAMSVHPILWEHLGADVWKGEEVKSKEYFLSIIETKAMSIISFSVGRVKDPMYQNTTGVVLEDIFKLAKPEISSFFKTKFHEYIQSHDSGTRQPRQGKSIYKPKTTEFLQIDMDNYTRIYEEFFKTGRHGVVVHINDMYKPLYWGCLYMTYLIHNQIIPLRKDMTDTLAEMLVNVNNYVLFNIYLWIILYKPFSTPGSIPAINDELNDELNDALDSVYSGKDKYLGRHDTFLSKFPRFNYTVMVGGFSYDFRILNEFTNYLIRIPSEYEAVKTMLSLTDSYVNFSDRTILKGEELSPHSAVALSKCVEPQCKTGSRTRSPKGRRDKVKSSRTGMIKSSRTVMKDRRKKGKSRRVSLPRISGGKSKRSLTMPIKRSHYHGKVKRNVIIRKSRKTKNNKKTKRNKTKKK